jgi:hypothetical protein
MVLAGAVGTAATVGLAVGGALWLTAPAWPDGGRP